MTTGAGKRRALVGVGVASLLILAACLVGGEAAGVAFALLGAAFPVGLMLVGVAREGRIGPARWPILLLLAVLLASVGGMLALRGRGLDAPGLLGLPPGAAVQIVGLFLAPLAIVGLGFAWTFRHFAPSPEELDELRAAAAERRES